MMKKEDLLLRSQIIDKVKRVVIKTGTGVLTTKDGEGQIRS